jgi:MoaA/NifB/PqqE/SkfB family radical SAM enzyme
MNGISLVWDIHYKCNYRCPYCWFEGGLKRIYLNNRDITIEEWTERWNYLYEKYGAIHVEITGGEPFIYPDFVDLVKEISKRHTIRITTNLSVNIDNFLIQIEPERVKVISSFHPSFADLGRFLRKSLLLKDKGYGGIVIYVAYPPQLSLAEHYGKIFEENGIIFSVTPFWGTYKGLSYPNSYSEEERKILRQYLRDEDRLKYTLNTESPRGKLCSAGQNFAILFEDGKVARCGQLKDAHFTNLFDEYFSLLNNPLPCESDFCPCDDHKYLV